MTRLDWKKAHSNPMICDLMLSLTVEPAASIGDYYASDRRDY